MTQPHPSPAAQPKLHALGSDVMQALQQGHYLEAVKLLRQQPGMGLKEAKDIIDAVQKQLAGHAKHAPDQAPHAPGHSDLAPGEVPHGAGQLSNWLLVATCIGLVLWFVLRRGV